MSTHCPKFVLPLTHTPLPPFSLSFPCLSLQGRQYVFNALDVLLELGAPGLPWVWEFDQSPGDFSIWPGRDDELIAKMASVNANGHGRA